MLALLIKNDFTFTVTMSDTFATTDHDLNLALVLEKIILFDLHPFGHFETEACTGPSNCISMK